MTTGAPPSTARVAPLPPAASSTHPPRPPLALNVAVVGHRPGPDRPTPERTALGHVIRHVLQSIRDGVDGIAVIAADLFDDTTHGCRIRLLSSLAAGADQWVAEEALTLGYSLHTVLPFARQEYVRDFGDPALRAQFDALLERADSVLELDGARGGERTSHAYQAASRTALQTSDLLIALWDGADQQGLGGTGQTVREALLNGVPVIWIPWTAAPRDWHLINESTWRGVEPAQGLGDDDARLVQVLADILLPPDHPQRTRAVGHTLRNAYASERLPGISTLVNWWNGFVGLILLGSRRRSEAGVRAGPTHADPADARAPARSWDEERAGFPSVLSGLMAPIDRHFFTHYAWANRLSIHYANRYRSGFLANYLLGAMAVMFALAGLLTPDAPAAETWFVGLELLVIALIVLMTVAGSKRGWHERWIEYRTLAERLRLARFMALLGGWRQNAILPGHLTSYGEPTGTWVYWHFRAVERAFGINGAALDAPRLEAIRWAMQDALTLDQLRYHRRNAQLEQLDERLHVLGTGCFIATLVACALHLALIRFGPEMPHRTSAIFIVINALLPTCGAAIAGIRGQGELHRVARRSRSMEQELDDLRLRISMVPARAGELHSQEMRLLAERIAKLMLNETLDWRVVFQDRPLVLPS